MKKLTNQQAFDIAVARLLVQNKKSIGYINHPKTGTRVETCLYKTVEKGETLHCGVGCLIPKDQYQESLEGLMATEIMELVPAISDLNWELLSSIQHIHDNWDPVLWKAKFRLLGEEHNLDTSIIDSISEGTIPKPVIHIEELVI